MRTKRMKLSLMQAADQLGITKAAVKKLEAEGKLTDLNPVKEGVTRHFRCYDSQEVNGLKRAGAYTPKRHQGRNANSRRTHANVLGSVSPSLAGVGLFTRLDMLQTSSNATAIQLDHLEKMINELHLKVDALIAIWK